MNISIGEHKTRSRVLLAPMSGVSDEPFRMAADRHGAGLVVSEMVASEDLVRQRPDVVKRACGSRLSGPFVIQLAGREPRWMAEGARMARDLGADIIDINMGCPARQVTGGLSGSALMRNLDHAQTLIEATVGATDVPVTLKMRLGWDHGSINAPELAQRAEAAGVRMITVHGRTRSQFYKGQADWAAIRSVRQATRLPLIANGDGKSLGDIRQMFELSGADGVMIGRGAYGRPWLVGELAEQLDPGSGISPLSLQDKLRSIRTHYRDMLEFYGPSLAVRVARKHLGWYICHFLDLGVIDQDAATQWRARLVRENCPDKVQATLDELAQVLCENERRAA
jgi:nifR3 family TIM-barrel protein